MALLQPRSHPFRFPNGSISPFLVQIRLAWPCGKDGGGRSTPLFADTPTWESWENEGDEGCAGCGREGAEGKAVPRTVDWEGVDPVRWGSKGGSIRFTPRFNRMEKENDTLACVEPRGSRKDAPFLRSFSAPSPGRGPGRGPSELVPGCFLGGSRAGPGFLPFGSFHSYVMVRSLGSFLHSVGGNPREKFASSEG